MIIGRRNDNISFKAVISSNKRVRIRFINIRIVNLSSTYIWSKEITTLLSGCLILKEDIKELINLK